MNTGSGPVHLFPLPIEALSLCAYTDSHFGRHREYWRGFIKVLLPSLLERDPAEVEELVEHSIMREWTELISDNNPRKSVGALIRHMSASLSLMVGHPSELGFAAFLDCALPTRLHALPGAHRHRPSDSTRPVVPAVQNEGAGIDDVFIDWFSRLALIQADENFSKTVAQWQSVMADLPMAHLHPVGGVQDEEGAA